MGCYLNWISFNSTSGGGGIDYGVDIDETTGIFSGYAWSENIGWISFNQSELSGCPSGTCRAEVHLFNHEVSGWARALAYGDGWEGWIRLRGSNYGVRINNITQEFEGWAWGNNVIGWISFNCNNPETGNVCSASDYKVKISFFLNSPPTATDLTVTPLDYCYYSLPTNLSWTFSDLDPGDTQEAYQVQIDNNSGFSSLEVDSGKVYSSSNAYMASGLSYNTTYYWRLKVWDNNEDSSNWISGPSFATPLHAYPDPDFTWSPSSPSMDEIVQLCAVQETGICVSNESICYDSSNNEISCSGETFLWTLPPEAELVGTSTTVNTENPQIRFTDSDSYNVILQITDDIGTCSITKEIGVSFPLPEWQESAP